MKLYKNGANLISKQFSNNQSPTVVWELHVYPNGKREEDMNSVSFFLRQVGLQVYLIIWTFLKFKKIIKKIFL